MNKFAISLIEFTLTTEDKNEFDVWLNKLIEEDASFYINIHTPNPLFSKYGNVQYIITFKVGSLDKMFYILHKLDITIYDN